MRYLKAGSGPALILVHGLMGYSFSWRFTIPALAPHATVYAIDNLGAGLSPANAGMDCGIDCTVRATAERVLQFADAVGIGDFDLLGTSHGGGVAIMVAAICAERKDPRSCSITGTGGSGQTPQGLKPSVYTGRSGTAKAVPYPNPSCEIDSRVRKLVLVAPVNPWSAHGKRLAPFLGSAFGAMLFRNTFERWPALHGLGLRRMFGDKAKIPPDALAGYRIPVQKNHVVRHALRIVKNWTADLAELEAALPKIRDYPTLLMWGTRDRAVYFESAEPLRRNFRSENVRLVAFEGAGHLPYEEAPEAFNRALVEFLV
jgi:pimeloyl-ACP methyl ester carboxylesterase